MEQQQGLLGSQMAPQQQPGLERNASTFLTLQLMQHFFEPEQAAQWAQAAAAGNPAEVVSQLALAGIQEGMAAAGGRATEEDGMAALQEVVTAMVLFLVASDVLPQEAAEPVAQEALQLAMGGGQEQQQVPPAQPQQQGMMA